MPFDLLVGCDGKNSGVRDAVSSIDQQLKCEIRLPFRSYKGFAGLPAAGVLSYLQAHPCLSKADWSVHSQMPVIWIWGAKPAARSISSCMDQWSMCAPDLKCGMQCWQGFKLTNLIYGAVQLHPVANAIRKCHRQGRR